MRERPILFSAPMVRAILEGRKTQTRRVLKTQPVGTPIAGQASLTRAMTKPVVYAMWDEPAADGATCCICPYGVPGDRLIPAVPLAGYDKRYCVDVFGKVWSRAKGDWKRLVPGVTSKGYATITPARGGKYTTQFVHRLVCESFYGAAPDGFDQVRHLNGDQADNAPENLDWGTQNQNWADRAAHGRGMGENHHAARLTERDVSEIRLSVASQRSLAARICVSQSTIQQARVGETWRDDLTPAPANMPRWAGRIVLEVTDVRVERLQAIREADARAEGIEPRGRYWQDYLDANAGVVCSKPVNSFRSLWSSINGADSWAANPWVWVVAFRRVEAPQP